MTTFQCPSDILFTSFWSITTRWSMRRGSCPIADWSNGTRHWTGLLDRSATRQLLSLYSKAKWQQQQIPYYHQCYLTHCWPTKLYLYIDQNLQLHVINTFQFTNSSRTTKHQCKHYVTWPAARMVWSFGRKLSNSWPVQKNGSKTWTGELLDTLLVTHKSAITDHTVEENHVSDWDKAKVVDTAAQRETRWIWIKEALWIRKTLICMNWPHTSLTTSFIFRPLPG